MSEIVLLDTNVISFLMKGDSRSTAYKPHLQGRRLAISFMTVAELFQGRPISPQDAWIAASALQYQLSLVTHNPDDFAFIEGLIIITTLSRPA